MKMVAAARLRRAEDRLKSARPYAEYLQGFINTLITDSEIPHPLAEQRSVQNTGLLVLTSDRGLCGSFNANTIRVAHNYIRENGTDHTKLFVVGRKGLEYFKRRHVDIAQNFTGLDPALIYREIKEISDAMSTAFLTGKVDRIQIAYSRYVSPAVSRPGVFNLLPLSRSAVADDHEEHEEHVDFIYQPDAQSLLEILFPKFLYTQLVLALAESFASEQGQRMVAMTTATDNASEMISSLTLYYNKVRQAAITKEISEIVGGAEALR